MACIRVRPDGSPCYLPGFVFDPRRRGMLCREHALDPLERALGQRPDLEEKSELILRFLSLPTEHRHEILEALPAAERREFIQIAHLYELNDIP